MSGQTALQCYTLSAFRGLNLHDDDRQIEPGQFTDLINASTDNGAIKADEVDAIINMAVPQVFINNISKILVEKPWANTSAFTTGVSAFALAFSLTGISAGSIINALVPFTCSALATGNDFWTFKIFDVASASVSPKSNISNNLNLGIVVTATATASNSSFFSNKSVIINNVSGNQIPNTYFAVFNGGSASGATGSQFGYTMTTTASATSAWGLNYGPYKWSCVISKSTLSGGHILNMLPIINQSDERKFTAVLSAASAMNYVDKLGFYSSAYGNVDVAGFGRLYDPVELNGGKSSFILGYTQSANAYLVNKFISANGTIFPEIIKYPDFNLIEKSAQIVPYDSDGTVFSLSTPETDNEITFDYNSNILDYGLSGYGCRKKRRKLSGGYFNSYLITIRDGQPVAYLFSNDYVSNSCGISPQPLITPIFKNPKGVVVYQGGYVFYYNAYEGNSPKFGRAYFNGTPGIIDSFTAQSYENISYDQEILTAEEWYGSIIFFFADRIKRYSGTPGNAVLETIFYKGVTCGEVVCKTGRGIFFVSTDGLYLYNGTFNRITDWSTKFDQANCRNVKEDGWLEFNDKTQELYFYPGYDSVVNVWNAKHDFFRQKDYTAEGVTGGMRFFKYYDNMDLKTAISYPGITHVSQVEAGTTFKPITITSGWIDVDEGQNKTNYEQKRFDRAIIEFTGKPNDGSYFNFILYFDDGTNITTNNILMAGSGIVSYPIPIKKQAKLIKYSITAPAQASQLAIQKLKFYYDLTMLR